MQKQHFRQFPGYAIVPVLIALLLLGGCQPGRPKATATTAAPYENQTAETYEHFEETQLAAQTEFDRQMDALFLEEIATSQLDLHFLLKNPESYGITHAENMLPPLSIKDLEKNLQERQELERNLAKFDLSLLTEEQRLTLRILQSYLDTEKKADGLELYAQPLAVTIGIQAQLPILLSEYTFYTKKDVEDYLKILSGLDEYYAQILDFEKQKSEAGLMMNDTAIDHIIESCQSYLLAPDNNFMIDTFQSRLKQIPDLTEEERSAYIQQNATLLESDFVPAYQLLIDGMEKLKGTGSNNGGQCGYPKGKEYYEYLVYSATGTSYNSVNDMLKAMESDLNAALRETSNLLKQYPNLGEEIDTYKFRQTQPDQIMEELKALSLPQYPELPECRYIFKDVPKSLELSLSPAFYLMSPIDDYQNNTIYINHNPEYSSSDLYTVIAHEGYPGHLYQNVYFHTHCNSNVRMLLSFPGYTEGWATYVEYESYLLDNGLSPEMGQLLAANQRAMLSLSACLDVYINYLGWDQTQVKTYMNNFGSYADETIASIYNTMVETPSNYLSYYVGCLEFRNMRKIAEAKLGKKFDLKTFHSFLLDMGSAPFDVIQPYFTSWLASQM